MDDYESVLLIIRECFVYKIPPRSAARGYRAAEWGDLATAYLWKGRLRVVSKGNKCEIRMEDNSTGELFAMCPYEISSNSVEAVLDSSRYFVLKIESDGRHAFVGMGFQERSDAFDFNVTLQDFIKQLRAEKNAAERASQPDNTPKVDYSLKEGQTINITIGNVGAKRTRPKPANTSGGGGLVPLLPPPPSASQVKQQQQQNKQQQQQNKQQQQQPFF